MPFLSSLAALPRVMRHGAAVGADLPPDAAVVLDAPDAPLQAALTAAGAGDFGPARALLAATRRDARWERRDGDVAKLAGFALHNPGWLHAWLDAEPDDPDAVLVKADLCIRQAWEVRSGARAERVAHDQFQAFFALLGDAAPVIRRAAELNPADPVPWRIALTHARGSQAPRAVFDAHWEEAAARAPCHYGCHVSALQYLCRKWYGSHEEMFAFAERAADQALPGSRLHALPLLAAVEYRVVDGVREGADPAFDARAEAAVRRALDLSASFAPGDPEAAGFRNHLALMLLLAGDGRTEEALEAFRATGVHATRLPWAYFGDPREQFLTFRRAVRTRAAARTPFFSRPSVPAPRPSGDAGDADRAPRTLAVCAAPLPEVAEAALLCRTGLLLAPEGAHTLVEPGRDPEPPAGRPGADRLTSAAESLTAGEKWPVLVLTAADGGRRGVTLVRRGAARAVHQWDPGAPVPSHEEADRTARALADAFGVADPRPLTALLRGTDDPVRRQADLVAALGLPALPPGFGDRPRVLADRPDARAVARRGLAAGIRDTLATGPGELPPDPREPAPAPLPARWWALRVLGLLVFAPAAVYAWWSPQVGAVRAVLATVAALYVGGQLADALRRRRGGPGGPA
ncbi:hypothetical protein [Streptomyces sp. NPDC001380]|uniref:hypothetical protein n=1 Tax=Streptomyces sp. NPDC001380 TaxID=3364566 RepID=UPI0036968A3A